MKAGVSTASLYPMLVEDAVEALNNHNIKNIEIFANTLSEIKPDYIKQLNKRIAYNGQTVASMHPFTCAFEPFMLFTDYQRRFEDALECHRYFFQAMNILNAKIFIFHGDRKQGKLCDKGYFERFARLRDLGKEYGITVAQENVERCKSSSLDFLKDMISYLDGDVSLVFDNKQAIRSNVKAEEFIAAVGKNIVHMHISDHNSKNDCINLGEGDLDLCKLLAQLKDIGYNSNIMVELYSERLDSLDKIYESFAILDSSIYTSL